MPRRAYPTMGKGGFSLIEILVVLGLISILIGLGFLAANNLRREGSKREAMAYGAAVAAALEREYMRLEYGDKTALVALLFPSPKTMQAPDGSLLQGRSCESLPATPSFRGIQRPRHVECLVCVYSSIRSAPDANNPVCPRPGGTHPLLVEEIRVYTRSSFSPPGRDVYLNGKEVR